MKFVKFLTRRYTLLEHDLISCSVIGKSSVPEVYYTEGLDFSNNGLIDIYIPIKDLDDNKKRIELAVKKDKDYVSKMFKKGLLAIENLSKLPFSLKREIIARNNKQIIIELNNLKSKIFDFSGYFDFTHHLGASKVELNEKQIKQLSDFHEKRKAVFLDYFKFIGEITREIAKKMKIKSGNLDFAKFEEIISLLEGKISPEDLEDLQEKRRNRYIMIMKPNNFRVITEENEIEEYFNKFKREVIEENTTEIKGQGLNKGIIKGEVKIITQTTPLKEITPDKIIVTQMTHPDMTPMLKKVKAIVTDEGGLLCHTANIAREFNILALIGTKIATKLLKDGDIIELDTDKGTVKKIR